MLGADYSFVQPRPRGRQLLDMGFGFAIRYLAPSSEAAKVIDKAELEQLRGDGVEVCLNWEDGATNMLGGAAQGKADAAQATMQAEQLGVWPCVIYFSADFDATPAQQDAIDQYLYGCGVVMGPQWVGMYGGYYPLSRALDAGKAALGWQTFAWSGGLWDPRAVLRQVATPAAAAAGYRPTGSWYDLDVAMAPWFGQIGGSPAAAPARPAMSGPGQRFIG